MSHSFHLSSLPQGFTKASLSMDASEENDGYSSAEDPMNSDPEDEGGKKLVSKRALCCTIPCVLCLFER